VRRIGYPYEGTVAQYAIANEPSEHCQFRRELARATGERHVIGKNSKLSSVSLADLQW
jgi:hypothetical protein